MRRKLFPVVGRIRQVRRPILVRAALGGRLDGGGRGAPTAFSRRRARLRMCFRPSGTGFAPGSPAGVPRRGQRTQAWDHGWQSCGHKALVAEQPKQGAVFGAQARATKRGARMRVNRRQNPYHFPRAGHDGIGSRREHDGSGPEQAAHASVFFLAAGLRNPRCRTRVKPSGS